MMSQNELKLIGKTAAAICGKVWGRLKGNSIERKINAALLTPFKADGSGLAARDYGRLGILYCAILGETYAVCDNDGKPVRTATIQEICDAVTVPDEAFCSDGTFRIKSA